MEAEDIRILFSSLLTGIFALILIIKHSKQENRLEDLDDNSVLYINQLSEIALLSGEMQFAVVVYRKNGEVHNNYVCESAESAIKKAVSTFRRAKIEYVEITTNSVSELSFERGYELNPGRRSGKRIGSVEIKRGRSEPKESGGDGVFYTG